MIWGVIPAFFKAYWNTNETLFTLMMNYVATQVITYCIIFWENAVVGESENTARYAGINVNVLSFAPWLCPVLSAVLQALSL